MSTAATVTANHNANPASEWERQVPEAERLVRVIPDRVDLEFELSLSLSLIKAYIGIFVQPIRRVHNITA